MAVVTISRHFGAGGHTLGEKLCERFGFHLVDASSIDELALKDKVNPNWLTAMEKEASSTVLSLLSTVVSRGGLFYKKPGSPGDEADRRRYIDFLTRIFTAMANEGGYVIVGRGGQVILQDHPKAVHLLLVADYESRVSFLVEHHALTRAAAENAIREKEKERASLASRLFDRNIDDPCLYHMVLNTSRMPYDWMLETVFQLVGRSASRG